MGKKHSIIPMSFYTDENVQSISQALLGKFLVTQMDGKITSGMIVETEAYQGIEDKASHAYNQRRTQRTETMYAKGGVAYVYLCYGIHHLFNIVTAGENVPHAVLVRAIEPVDGLEFMLARRKRPQCDPLLTCGPGVMSAALGITTKLDGTQLKRGNPIWVEDRGVKVLSKEIIASPRVGIDYAQEHKDLPWRFRLKGSPWTSKAK